MNKSIFSKVYDIFVKIAIAILLVLGLWLVIGGAYKKDIGNLSDWVSSACNIIMAYAAYKAFTLAKDYFTDVIKKDGYELVKKLQLELIPQLEENLNLSTINVLDQEVPLYIEGKNGIFQDDDEESYLGKSLLWDLKDLQKRISESYRLDRDIRDAIQRIEVFGWHLLPAKRKQLINTLVSNEKLFIQVHGITIYLSEIMSREAPHFLPLKNESKLNHYDPNSRHAPPCVQHIDKLVDKLITYQQSIYDQEVSTPYDKTISALRKYLSDGKHLKNYFKYSRD